MATLVGDSNGKDLLTGFIIKYGVILDPAENDGIVFQFTMTNDLAEELDGLISANNGND